jgi:hypothetical protein
MGTTSSHFNCESLMRMPQKGERNLRMPQKGERRPQQRHPHLGTLLTTRGRSAGETSTEKAFFHTSDTLFVWFRLGSCGVPEAGKKIILVFSTGAVESSLEDTRLV